MQLFCPPKKRNPEGNADIQPEVEEVNEKKHTTTKQILTRKIHANDLHTKLVHPREEKMCGTAKHLQYSIKGTLVFNFLFFGIYIFELRSLLYFLKHSPP